MTPQKMSRAEVIEECARVCDQHAQHWAGRQGYGHAALVVAAAIRALASQAAAPAEQCVWTTTDGRVEQSCELPAGHEGRHSWQAAAPAEGREDDRDKAMLGTAVSRLMDMVHERDAEITRLCTLAARGEPVAGEIVSDSIGRLYAIARQAVPAADVERDAARDDVRAVLQRIVNRWAKGERITDDDKFCARAVLVLDKRAAALASPPSDKEQRT